MGKVSFVEYAEGFNVEVAFGRLKSELRQDIEFRLSDQPDVSGADMMRLKSKRPVATFKKAVDSENRKKELAKITNQLYADTNEAYFIDNGVKGYVSLESIADGNRKRGKRYTVAVHDNNFGRYDRLSSFNSKLDAVNKAREVKMRYLTNRVVVLNEKNEVVSVINLKEKYYDKKPNLKAKATRKVLPNHEYVFVGCVFVH